MSSYEWLRDERLRQILIVDEVCLRELYERYRETFTDDVALILALMETRSEEHLKRILSMVVGLEAVKKLKEYIECIEQTGKIWECWRSEGDIIVRWNNMLFRAKNNVEAILLARYLASKKGGEPVIESFNNEYATR